MFKRKNLNLSGRQTLTLAQDIRAAASIEGSRKVVETSFEKKMMLKSHQLDDFFEHTKIKFVRDIEVSGIKYSESFNQHVITVNDISGFVDHIVQQRNLNNENIVVRWGFLQSVLVSV